ncbi:MAG: hypothetical protein LH613_15740 [Chamaesiphon sp.]|nr:hypothetical protein [Chamaesiphon sp.]
MKPSVGTWQQEVSDFLGSQAIELWVENANYFRNPIEISPGLKLWLGFDIEPHRQIDRAARYLNTTPYIITQQVAPR